ncbi:tetratricopeptide repeat protein [Pseudodesulfovibrio cashew]|uniref:Tetratricopeptide repeat protein n=1 Tax=Pseudodesulfovibrio cashew TaxID=2678688 RepID=A0A6I6JKN0_9BACT|nr:tetratricopeptide repeat protein [Pseudodesulfovibrio cashew]QGY41739.1 tetratricopeptide repeat protein [Pseudodesulfovibrio cashew]
MTHTLPSSRLCHGPLLLLLVTMFCCLVLPTNANAGKRNTGEERLSPRQYAAIVDARNFLDKGEPDKAIKTLQPQAKTKRPPRIILSHLGWALIETGDKPGALDVYAVAVKLYPDDPEVRRNLGVLLLELGRYSQAADALEKAYTLQPEDKRDPALLLQAAYALTETKNFKRALGLAERALKAATEPPLPWFNLAVHCCLRLHRQDKALHFARNGTRLHPREEAAWTLYARLLARTGDPLGGAAALETALALRAGDGRERTAALSKETATLYALGHAHAEAARHLDDAPDPGSQLSAADLYRRNGRNREALAALNRFEAASRKDTTDDRAAHLRAAVLGGRILLDMNRTEDGISRLLKAADKAAPNASKTEQRLRGTALLMAGEARWMERKWRDAAAIFTKLATVPGFGSTGTSLAAGMRALLREAAMAHDAPATQPAIPSPSES